MTIILPKDFIERFGENREPENVAEYLFYRYLKENPKIVEDLVHKKVYEVCLSPYEYDEHKDIYVLHEPDKHKRNMIKQKLNHKDRKKRRLDNEQKEMCTLFEIKCGHINIKKDALSCRTTHKNGEIKLANYSKVLGVDYLVFAVPRDINQKAFSKYDEDPYYKKNERFDFYLAPNNRHAYLTWIDFTTDKMKEENENKEVKDQVKSCSHYIELRHLKPFGFVNTNLLEHMHINKKYTSNYEAYHKQGNLLEIV
jgi:hypothetical protein